MPADIIDKYFLVGKSSIVDKSINRHFHFVNQMESNGWVSNRNNRYSVPQ